MLQTSFNEEQLYFYYAIILFNFFDLLEEQKDVVIKSNNQILVSYYLKDGIFNSEEIDILKEKDDEKYWFQNYHLILYSEDLLADLENSIYKYLIPQNAKEQTNDKAQKRKKKSFQRQSYMDFYKKNLELKNSIIREIHDVHAEIVEYLKLKVEESEAAFNTAGESEEDYHE